MKHIFIIPGFQIDEIFKVCIDTSTITPIIVNHELSAGFMAEGYAIANKTIGVACSIGGPGIAYMIPSAINAKLEELPVVYISGANSIKNGIIETFQNTSSTGSNDNEIFKTILSKSYNHNDIKKIKNISKLIPKKAPCHIAIPYDIQRTKENNANSSPLKREKNLRKVKTYKTFSKKNKKEISLKFIFKTIRNELPKNSILCTDSGQTRFAANKYLKDNKNIKLFQSSKQSPMGWGICSSMGAKLATNKSTVVSIFGDGSMRMFGIELSTAIKYNLSIVFILCDNSSYGTVYSRLKNTPYEKFSLLDNINWEEYVNSFGMQCFSIKEKKEIPKTLNKALKLKGSSLIWIKTPKIDKNLIKQKDGKIKE